MKGKKGWLYALTFLLSMALILSGCGAGSNNGGSASPGTDQGGDQNKKAEQVTITLNGWGNATETALLKEVLADFEAKYPNIKVNYEAIQDQYMDVLKTRLIGGEAGDVFYLDSSEAAGMIQQGVLEPLNSYITNDYDLADIEEPLLNAYKEGDQIYGIPKDYSTLGLYYNKKMFADAGIKEPPKTWDELRTVSKQLTKDLNGDGKIDQYGLGVAPELARQYFMILAYGGTVVNDQSQAAFATPDGLKGLQLVIDQHLKDKSSVQPSDVGVTWGGEMFGQKKVAMVLEGPWAIPFLKDTAKDLDYGIAELPTVNGKNLTMAYTVSYSMNAASKHKKEAWTLISYLTGKEGMKKWTSLGIALPSRKSVAAELGFDKDPLRAALVKGASYAIPWQAGPHLPIIMNNFNNQFVSAFIGQQNLDAAMKKAQETANKEIEAAK